MPVSPTPKERRMSTATVTEPAESNLAEMPARALRRADRRRRPVGHRRRLPSPGRLPGQDLRDPRGARRDRRHLGPVPLPRHPLGLRHVHAGLLLPPWEEAKAIADGPSILSYIRETARDHGIDSKIRFHHRVVRAEWSTCRGALDRGGRAHRHGGDGPPHLRLPVHVHRLLPLRRGLHAGLRGHRALRRPDRAPAALARGPRLRGQARRRDRQRRDCCDARSGDGGAAPRT